RRNAGRRKRAFSVIHATLGARPIRTPIRWPIMGPALSGESMTAGIPRASFVENARFTLTYLLPSMLRGVAIPLPFWTEVATRFDTGRGAATVERLTKRYAGRPVILRGIGG